MRTSPIGTRGRAPPLYGFPEKPSIAVGIGVRRGSARRVERLGGDWGAYSSVSRERSKSPSIWLPSSLLPIDRFAPPPKPVTWSVEVRFV